MDERCRDDFVQRARRRGADESAVAVTLEEFFDGNDDAASIAPNLGPSPDLLTIRKVLERLREHPAVQDVFVELDQLEYDDYPAGWWPDANGVGVITTLTSAEVDELTREALTDPASGPYPDSAGLPGAPQVLPGYHYLEVWWD